MNELKKVIISGGGTGGHIFPAVSIANALRKRFPDIDILFVGAEGRMEMERVPKAGYPMGGLPVSGFDRKNLLRNFKVLWRLWKSMRRAKSVIKSFKPQVAVGVGGYASGPTLKAAQKKGIPTVLQEQNSYPGVTNKMLGKNARAVCTAYDEAARFFPEGKVVLTGNPVRAALLDVDLTQAEAKSRLGFDPAKPLVLVVGGSLGARTINRSMAAGLQQFVDSGIQLLWQTGKAYENEIPAALKGMPDSIKATPFIDDMGLAYRAADLVVARAGAGTISELQLLGKAVLLVPSPNVAEDHQRKNAQALVNHQAAEMVLDAEAPARLTAEAIALVKQPQRLKAMSEAISAMALRDSADKIVDEILKATEGL
ncbi:MAG: undecaprenyldiphospho-muramoylpentapeptide beta-N-acetylglucosaminyltransferase [Muribaculaceae bacterium]|nr:undecaprenyldiphospho-muramoylpentapeptide beta-N-acetylglucosaminyltransferase [Muribaculaceae bacterium]